MKNYGLFLVFSSLITLLQAQTLNKPDQPTITYAVQLGVFDESVKQADFEAIRSYAYVYKREGIVYVGAFNSEETAEPVLTKIKAKGYDDAFIAAKPLAKSKAVHVIQIASKSAGEVIDWKNYAKVGDLFTMPTMGVVRILHGYYTDINDARVKLKEIQKMGFVDAFLRTVKEVQINNVTDFDTGDAQLVKKKEEPVGVKGLPTIYNTNTVSVKRKSAIKLQEALKELGTYSGTIDGKFGKGTSTAYDNALKTNRRLATYNELSQKHDGFEGWEDVRLLVTVTRQLNLKENIQPIVDDLLLNLPATPLSAKEVKTAFEWHSNTWKALEKWSALSQYNDQVYTALKVAYYRSLVHLEDYYASKRIGGEAGTAMAVSIIKTLIEEDIESFK